MATQNGVPKTYSDAVRTLAAWHTEGLDADVEVFAFPDPNRSVVRLVEVSGVFPSSGEARPVSFGKSSDFPFPSLVIQVTPEEWKAIQDGSLRLPQGWILNERQPVDVNG